MDGTQTARLLAQGRVSALQRFQVSILRAQYNKVLKYVLPLTWRVGATDAVPARRWTVPSWSHMAAMYTTVNHPAVAKQGSSCTWHTRWLRAVIIPRLDASAAWQRLWHTCLRSALSARTVKWWGTGGCGRNTRSAICHSQHSLLRIQVSQVIYVYCCTDTVGLATSSHLLDVELASPTPDARNSEPVATSRSVFSVICRT